LKPLFLTKGLVDREFGSHIDGTISERQREHSLSRTVFDEIPSHLFGPLATARSQLTFRTPYLDNSLVELAYRAPDTSRQTPAAALRLIASGQVQLGKTPTDLGFSIGRQSPLDVARRLFCKATFKLDYWDKEGLPRELAVIDYFRPLFQRSGLLGLHKFLPYRLWFREELHGIVENATSRAASGSQSWWNPAFVSSIAADHASGRRNYVREINAILTLDAIERVLLGDYTDYASSDSKRQDN
jgi:asparagine synthase (glutamine-hydrolysing)